MSRVLLIEAKIDQKTVEKAMKGVTAVNPETGNKVKLWSFRYPPVWGDLSKTKKQIKVHEKLHEEYVKQEKKILEKLVGKDATEKYQEKRKKEKEIAYSRRGGPAGEDPLFERRKDDESMETWTKRSRENHKKEVKKRFKADEMYQRGEMIKEKYVKALDDFTAKDKKKKEKAQGILGRLKGLFKTTLKEHKKAPNKDLERRLQKLKEVTKKINIRLKEIDTMMKETESKKAKL